MTDYTKKLLPRFRYGVIHPRAHEDVQRGPCYQLYRLLPNDFMEVATGLGLENYTQEGVDKAIKNYWSCVDRLVKEKVDHIVLSGAPIAAVLTRPRVLQFIRETKEKYGIPVDSPLEALIAAMKHLGHEQARGWQPMGGPCEQCDRPLSKRRRHRSGRYH